MALTRVVLDHYGSYSIYTNDFARGLKASATSDGTNWFPVQVEPTPPGPLNPATVRLDPKVRLRAIRFETTASHGPEWWGIFEVFVFGPAK